MSSAQPEGKAPPRQEVEAWLSRIDDITAAVQDILTEDPVESAQKRQEREVERRRMEIEERREKVKMRYNTQYNARFERDDVIDALLKQADDVGCKSRGVLAGDKSLYSRAERVSLDEALRLKDEATKAVKALEWEKALGLYTTAIALNVVDTPLQCTLYNNRALVQLKLNRFIDAVGDASHVLREEPMNVKALLRRATALKRLHRPLDAWKDVEAALQREPTNQEVVGLAHLLRRAKKEHHSCTDFQHHHPEEAKQLVEAVGKLGVATKALRETGAAKSGGNYWKNASKAEIDQWEILQTTESLFQCLAVVQSFHRGAAVLFSLCDGMRPLAELISELLSTGVSEYGGSDHDALPRRMPTRGMVFFASLRLMASVLLGTESAAAELQPPAVESLVGSLVDLLTREGHLANGNGTMATPAVSILELLEGLALRFPVQVYAQCGASMTAILDVTVKERAVASNHLFFCCKILEALLMETSVSLAMSRDLEKHLPCVIRAALTTGFDRLKEVGLSLALRSSCVSGAWAKAMGTLEFTRLLARTLPSSFQTAQWDLSSLRSEEGLYAVVYNIFLQAESKPHYVGQWRAVTEAAEGGNSTFTLRTWRALHDWAMSSGSSGDHVVLHARMMGVLAKFAPHDEALRTAMLAGEETLWVMLESALPALESAAAIPSTLDEEEAMLGEGCSAAAWEIVEYSTTCVASFYAQRLLSREEGLIVPDRIAILLRIIHLAGINHMVALGNAALITSFVPPSACGHHAALKAVDVLLEALRGVRSAIFTIEHDGKSGTTQWTHAQTVQKNLAIALSRCCSVESQRERLRELRGFETLHAVLEQNT